ncbi:hypothetical protein [Corticibacter populi]|uniref:hypothetical protein n=1 Tax=Corticibacter populi TaxID=1550736 RepID=UPI001F5F0644|nr:hypothetical protein [Corticibacter populi]
MQGAALARRLGVSLRMLYRDIGAGRPGRANRWWTRHRLPVAQRLPAACDDVLHREARSPGAGHALGGRPGRPGQRWSASPRCCLKPLRAVTCKGRPRSLPQRMTMRCGQVIGLLNLATS